MAVASAVLKLQKAGFTQEQVEALSEFSSAQVDVSQLATRSELFQLATKVDLAELKADLLKWIVTLVLGQAAAVAALVKLL